MNMYRRNQLFVDEILQSVGDNTEQLGGDYYYYFKKRVIGNMNFLKGYC